MLVMIEKFINYYKKNGWVSFLIGSLLGLTFSLIIPNGILSVYWWILMISSSLLLNIVIHILSKKYNDR